MNAVIMNAAYYWISRCKNIWMHGKNKSYWITSLLLATELATELATQIIRDRISDRCEVT